MNKIILSFGVVVILFSLFNTEPAHTRSSGAPEACVGYVGQANCNSVGGCHSGGSVTTNSTKVTLAFVNRDTVYKADSAYNVQLTLASTVTGSRYGFELMALDSLNRTYGTLGTVTTRTKVVNFSGINFVTHSSAQSVKTWTFKWTAPHLPAGPVTFYAVVFSGSQGSSTLNLHKTKYNLYRAPDTTHVGITPAQIQAADLKVYPNPSRESAKASFSLTAASHVEATITSVYGEDVATVHNGTLAAGNHELNLPLANLPSGTYILVIRTGGRSVARRVTVN